MEVACPFGGDEFLLHVVDSGLFGSLAEKMNVLDASRIAETASPLGFANTGAPA